MDTLGGIIKVDIKKNWWLLRKYFTDRSAPRPLLCTFFPSMCSFIHITLWHTYFEYFFELQFLFWNFEKKEIGNLIGMESSDFPKCLGGINANIRNFIFFHIKKEPN